VNSHFGSWSPNVLSNLQKVISGVKTHCIETFFISLENSWNLDVWNGLAWPISTLETQVMAKRKAGSQIATKSQDSARFPWVKVTCNILLENSRRGLQLCFKPHFDQRFEHKIMGPQSCGSPKFGNFGISIWESRNKMPFGGCGPHGEAHSIL